MSVKSAIEWTEATWNPVTGCTKVSEGCDHCYAETFAERFRGVPGHPYEQGFDLKLWPERLDMPLRWKKPRLVFVNSMSDLFHDDVPDEFIRQAFAVMGKARQHTFQVLTKRPARMARLLSTGVVGEYLAAQNPLPNVWLGTSVENQKWADVRIPHLLKTPAAVRFLSCEPLLGPIDLDLLTLRAEDAELYTRAEYIRWVIVGGESGRGGRPMHPDWARSLRDQCVAAEVPFFFKQWGEWSPEKPETYHRVTRKRWSHPMFAWAANGEPYNPYNPPVDHNPSVVVYRVGKKAAGRELDGRTWDEMALAEKGAAP